MTATYFVDGSLNSLNGNYFTYDTEGRLQESTSTGPDGGQFYYDGDDLVGHGHSAYVWGPTGPVLEIDTNVSTLTFDPNGSLVARIGTPYEPGTGYVLDGPFLYDAYGLIESTFNSAWQASNYCPFQYKGQAGYVSRELNTPGSTPTLINCESRWYDPLSGRWVSRDPTGLEGGENLYEFCDSNPLMLVDFDGTSPQWKSLLARATGVAEGVGSMQVGLWSALTFGHSDDLINSVADRTGFFPLRRLTSGAWHEAGSGIGQVGSLFIPGEDVAEIVRGLAWLNKAREGAELFLNPTAIRFTQKTAGATFRNGKTLQATIDALRSGKMTMADFPPIRVFVDEGVTYTLDNRRLLVAKYLNLPIKVVEATEKEIANEIWWKMTTPNGGTIISVIEGWFH